MAGQDWNVTTEPPTHLKVSLIPQKIRDLKSSTKTIIQKEHVALSTSNSGGQHLKGAARVYLSDSLPGSDPEGNNLDTSATSDNGRLAIATGGGATTGLTNTIKVYLATSAGISTSWKDVRAAYAGTAVRVTLDNNVYMLGKNATGGSRVLIGMDASNVLQVGSGANRDIRRPDAVVGGDDDREIVDKAYVDDAIADALDSYASGSLMSITWPLTKNTNGANTDIADTTTVTAGFLLGYINLLAGSDSAYLEVYVDSDGTFAASAIKAKIGGAFHDGIPHGGFSFCVPIKSGDHFKVEQTAGTGATNRVYNWIPLS